MSDPVILATITMMSALGSAVVGLFNNYLAQRNAAHIQEVRLKMIQLEKNTDGMSTALVKITGKEAYSRGRDDVTQGLPDSGRIAPPIV